MRFDRTEKKKMNETDKGSKVIVKDSASQY